MSLYKSAGLFLILISASFSSFSSSYLSSPPLFACKTEFPLSPVYPPRALALQIKGRVKISFDIDAFGKIVNFRILDAQPSNMFERSLKDAAKLARFDCYGIPRKGVILTATFMPSLVR
ncbi:TonB family protein [Salmonella enterica]|nr:TonB family protein [Salmonella enterica]